MNGRFAIVWSLANIVGVTAFLVVASQVWIEPELADIPGASSGAAFVWAITAVPIALLAAVGHMLALSIGLWHRTWLRCGLVGVTGALWIVAVLIDNAHHGV